METLMLDVGYLPLARVRWRRALRLLLAGKVEMVEEYEGRCARAASLELRIPSVVRLLQVVRRRQGGVRFSRENVWARDKGRCQYCGARVSRLDFTYDHVVPRALGGATRWENVVVSCVPCNQRKGGRTPKGARMRLIGQPGMPKPLPGSLRLTFAWHEGMPTGWKQWLRSVAYWNAELESS
ncbi:MAG: HNH endonuclease [Myxococcales bacterium]|nr:HNH endonuclease [Myxococcales bacterium]